MQKQKRPIVITVNQKELAHRFRTLADANKYLLRLNENKLSHFRFSIWRTHPMQRLDTGKL